MRSAAFALAAALALSGCGGGSSDDREDARAELEQRLAQSSVGVCDGACTTFRARAATCSGEPVELEGRDWFRCRVEYRASGGQPAPAPDETCAALDDRDGHVARRVEECSPP